MDMYLLIFLVSLVLQASLSQFSPFEAHKAEKRCDEASSESKGGLSWSRCRRRRRLMLGTKTKKDLVGASLISFHS